MSAKKVQVSLFINIFFLIFGRKKVIKQNKKQTYLSNASFYR